MYLVFVLLGGGILAPWNVMVNVFDYFNIIWADDKGLDNSLTLAYSLPQIPISILMVKYGDYLHYNVRIIITLVCMLVTLILIPLIPEYLSNEQGHTGKLIIKAIIYAHTTRTCL